MSAFFFDVAKKSVFLSLGMPRTRWRRWGSCEILTFAVESLGPQQGNTTVGVFILLELFNVFYMLVVGGDYAA